MLKLLAINHETFRLIWRTFSTSTGKETFLGGPSAQYIEDMYSNWLKDPKSVHSSWDSYFRHSGYQLPPTTGFKKNEMLFAADKGKSASSGGASASPAEEYYIVQNIIREYQDRGHRAAKTNGLEDMYDLYDRESTVSQKLGKPPPQVVSHPIPASMMETEYPLPSTTLIGGKDTKLKLKEIIKRLEMVYCRHIGVEFTHLTEPAECEWIKQKFETPNVTLLTKEEKVRTLQRLCKATTFEAFLMKRWSAEKRFGIEGCDIVIPAIRHIMDEAAKKDTDLFILGMAHRGRLNGLGNVCKKPFVKIFAQFQPLEPEDIGAGDVKYHLGVYNEFMNNIAKKKIKVVLLANPSHLEVACPVVAGRAKAEQFYRNDPKGKTVMPIITHGDASICGEGVVYETQNLCAVPSFQVGGTVHIIVNNQVGFTTDPWFSRSYYYASDIGKMAAIPIFHVNSEDPESVIYCSKVACEWRNTFHKDVILDIIGYRRMGHNEQDEPRFTQPLKYAKIKDMKNVFEKYSAVAVKQGIVTEAEVKDYTQKYENLLEEHYKLAAQEKKIRFSDWIDSPWKGFFKNKDKTKCAPTGVGMDVIEHIANKFCHPPPGFTIHRALERIFNLRQEMLKNKVADWALGEALAIGSLLKEGYHVRLSGEDVERGTFSHRHHVIHDQIKANTRYTYLRDLFPNQAHYSVGNSPISEYGVLAFEHGYSMVNPNSLVIWEAQFGDFANNGQAVIDTMIASGECKWMRQCGMVILMPHCLEGQGPEHSSARVERCLDLSDDDPDYLPPDSPDFAVKQLHDINWIVANCTLPGNLFHILRRQIKLPFRKPLVIMTPKSLLRHPLARSHFSEMKEGTEFKRMIPALGPASQNPDKVKKLIFCSGKVYFEFVSVIAKNKLEDQIAVARVEQICPFPYDLVRKEIAKYKNAKIAWGQEEHKNSGCWMYVSPRLETAVEGKKEIIYIGRGPSASTASGNKIQYQTQYSHLMKDTIKL